MRENERERDREREREREVGVMKITALNEKQTKFWKLREQMFLNYRFSD